MEAPWRQIRDRRERKGDTQDDMAAYLKVRVRTVQRIEAGQSPASKYARQLQRRYGGRIADYEYELDSHGPRKTQAERISNLEEQIEHLTAEIQRLRRRR